MVRYFRILMIMMVGAIPLSYNACSSSNHIGDESLGSLDACQTQQAKVFEKTYYQFAKNNCIKCHSPGGTGKGYFYSTDLITAYKAFSYVGYSEFAKRAADDNHEPPYTGQKHKQGLKDLEKEWLAGIDEFQTCEVSDGSSAPVFLPDNQLDQRIQSLTKNLSPDLENGTSVTISWDLATEVYNPDGTQLGIPGTLSVLAVTYADNGGKSFYHIYRPVIDSPVDIHVESLVFGFNGKYLKTESTFTTIERDVRNSTQRKQGVEEGTEVLSEGTLIIETIPREGDFLNVTFGSISQIAEGLPLPPPGPSISIVSADVVVPEGNLIDVDGNGYTIDGFNNIQLTPRKFVDVVVSIDNSVNDFIDGAPVIIRLNVQGANNQVKNRAGLTVNFGGGNVTINRPDWDFANTTGDTYAVFPGEGNTATFKIEIAQDNRIEADEVINVSLLPPENGVRAGNSQMQITITDDDVYLDPFDNPLSQNDYATFYTTLSFLLNGTASGGEVIGTSVGPGPFSTARGALFQNCFECHNSTLKLGGYDLSNYRELLERGVLMPPSIDPVYNPADGQNAQSSSYMFIRTNAADNSNFLSMPLTGRMADEKVNAVKNWILNSSALNN